VFSKKVEYLHSLVYQALETIFNKKQKERQAAANRNKVSNEEQGESSSSNSQQQQQQSDHMEFVLTQAAYSTLCSTVQWRWHSLRDLPSYSNAVHVSSAHASCCVKVLMLCCLLCRMPQAVRGGDAGLLGGDGPEAFLTLGSQLELAPRADIDLADDEETGGATY
jgi:hypothetical protein